MYILGISGMGLEERSGQFMVGHDPAAALIKDGQVIAAAEEERFIRFKHAPGHFPFHAIKFCLQKAKIDITEVDYITGYFDPDLVFKNAFLPSKLYASPIEGIKTYTLWKIYKQKYLNNLKYLSLFLQKGESVVPLLQKKFHLVEHHKAHAASAFYMSGFNDATVLTIDGAGEAVSSTFWDGHNTKMEKFNEVFCPDSVGQFYSAFTEYLGFEPNEGEYKVMGLAAYGKPGISSQDLMHFDNGKIFIEPKVWGNYQRYSDYVVQRFGPARKKDEPLTELHENISYSIQETLQKTAHQMVEWAVDKTGKKNLCLAGGVALNSKMNGLLLRSGLVDNMFIQPAAGDSGTAIGSALSFYADMGYRSYAPMKHAYYGPDYSDEAIEEVLKSANLSYEYHKDIAGTAAELIAKGKLVGWFQGGMEWGPRALGARSIIADPTDKKMKEKINAAVKYREPFRPFCPSMLAEAKEEYLEQPRDSPFMILTFQVPKEKYKEIPAVVHVDGTVRPQTVEKSINPLYYRLIKEFESIKGIPVVLNTSFNIRGEPVVCSPLDATRTFGGCGLTHLAIGNYLVTKK